MSEKDMLAAARESYNKEDASIYAAVKKKTAAGKYASRNFADEEIVQMVSLYKSGASSYSIAEEFGTTHTTVRKLLHKAGVEMRNKGKHKPEPEPAPKKSKSPHSLSGITMLGRLDCMLQETYGTEAVITAVSGSLDRCELEFVYEGDAYTFRFAVKKE